MVLLGYNHLTTIATTDALAPLHFPKPTATYVTLTGISVSWNVLYCDAINYMAHRFFLPWLAGWLLISFNFDVILSQHIWSHTFFFCSVIFRQKHQVECPTSTHINENF